MVTKQQLDSVEKYADILWGKVGLDIEFTRHFHDRVNDARNKKPITNVELMTLFRKSYKKYGKTIASLGRAAQAVIKDMQNDINMPFVIQLDRNGQLDLVAKTIMRKKDFKTSNKKFTVESGAGEEGTNALSYKYKQDTPYQLTNGKTMKREKFVPKEIIDEDVPAFMGAVAQAAKDGKKEFEFGGKTYKVTLNKKVADKIAKNMDEADNTELDKKSLDAMIKNPDPKRAKEYGGKAAYVKMLMKKRKNLGEALKCPLAVGNVELNTKNRDATIKKYMYGPLNVEEPGDYWEKVAKKWDTSVEGAKKSICENCVAFDISPRMKDCMPGKTSDDEGELGYCWMHHFKCHSARTCTTWAKGGPIKDDKTSEEWQNKSMNESTDLEEATLPFKELEKAWIRTKGNEKAREKLVKKHNLQQIISNVRPGAIKLGPLNDLKAKTSDHTMAGLDADGELIFVTNNPVKIYYPSNTKDRPRGEELKEDVSIETQRLRRVVQLSLNESDIARIDDFIVEANIELNMTPSKIQSAYKKYISERKGDYEIYHNAFFKSLEAAANLAYKQGYRISEDD